MGRYFVNSTTGRSRLHEAESAEIPRRYPMAVLAEAHPRAFALRGEEFSVRQADDVPTATLFRAIVERTDARLYEFARRRSGHGEVVGKVLGNGDDRLCFMLGPEARTCGAIGAWVTLAWESKRYRAKVAKVAINVIHEGDGTENVATDVLRRATGSDSVDDAKGRRLRLRGVEDGLWELELA